MFVLLLLNNNNTLKILLIAIRQNYIFISIIIMVRGRIFYMKCIYFFKFVTNDITLGKFHKTVTCLVKK